MLPRGRTAASHSGGGNLNYHTREPEEDEDEGVFVDGKPATYTRRTLYTFSALGMLLFCIVIVPTLIATRPHAKSSSSLRAPSPPPPPTMVPVAAGTATAPAAATPVVGNNDDLQLKVPAAAPTVAPAVAGSGGGHAVIPGDFTAPAMPTTPPVAMPQQHHISSPTVSPPHPQEVVSTPTTAGSGNRPTATQGHDNNKPTATSATAGSSNNKPTTTTTTKPPSTIYRPTNHSGVHQPVNDGKPVMAPTTHKNPSVPNGNGHTQPAPMAKPPVAPAPVASTTKFEPLYINSGSNIDLVVSGKKQWRTDVKGSTRYTLYGESKINNKPCVKNNDEDKILCSERFYPDEGGYKIPAPNGRYKIILYFEEVVHDDPNFSRQFHIKVENFFVRRYLDIMEVAEGPDIPLTVEHETTIMDGEITILFRSIKGKDHAKISAVEVVKL
jgi:hypothetical protein